MDIQILIKFWQIQLFTSHTSDNSSTFLNFPFHYQLLQHFPIQEQRPIRIIETYANTVQLAYWTPLMKTIAFTEVLQGRYP